MSTLTQRLTIMINFEPIQERITTTELGGCADIHFAILLLISTLWVGTEATPKHPR